MFVKAGNPFSNLSVWSFKLKQSLYLIYLKEIQPFFLILLIYNYWVVDIQTRKLNLIQELLKVQSEKLIEKLESIVEEEKKLKYEANLKPMSLEEFNGAVDNSLDDAKHERIIGTDELKSISKEWK